MKALRVEQAGVIKLKEVDTPKLRPGFCLVKIYAVALNPTDYKHLHYIECKGCNLGCDYAGTVEKVGPESIYKKGDRIAGFVHGGNTTHPEDGAFAQYTLVKEGLQFKIPKTMSFDQAASFGVAVTTVGMGLCQTLQLPLPGGRPSEDTTIFIYGGSTATGTIAIQIAKLAGLDVVTTCSTTNFSLVKSLGATAAFDYSDPRCVEDIIAYTKGGGVYHAFDCISDKDSAMICSKVLSTDSPSQRPRYCSTLPVKFPREDVVSTFILAYTAVGESFHKFVDFPADLQAYEAAQKFWGICQPIIDAGMLLNHPIEVREGGLDLVLEGFADMKEGRVRAKKLVYRIEWTSSF